MNEQRVIVEYYRVVRAWRECPPGSIVVLTNQRPDGALVLVATGTEDETVIAADFYEAVRVVAIAIAEGALVVIPTEHHTPPIEPAAETLVSPEHLERFRAARERIRARLEG